MLIAGGGYYYFTRQASPGHEVVGTWYDNRNQLIVFKGDGTLTATNTYREKRNGKWEITPDNKVRIKISPAIGGEARLPDPDLKDPVTRLDMRLDKIVEDGYVGSVFRKQK